MGLWEVPWLDKSKIMKPSKLSSNGKGLGWAIGKFQVLSPNGEGKKRKREKIHIV